MGPHGAWQASGLSPRHGGRGSPARLQRVLARRAGDLAGGLVEYEHRRVRDEGRARAMLSRCRRPALSAACIAPQPASEAGATRRGCVV